MTDIKLSQLPKSVSALTSVDYIVGVQSGPTDVLYSSLQISAGSSGIVTPYQFGAIADGGSHPLSTVYSTLTAAQVVYSFATSLTQEIDYCAVQKAFYTAFGFPGSEHNVSTNLNLVVRLQAGNYYLGADYIKTRLLRSGLIYGDGPAVSILKGVGQFILQFDGCWYTVFRDFQVDLATAGGIAVIDLDGNVSGGSNGVQGNSFYNINCYTQGSTYGLAVCRQGGGGGQGSENDYFNMHFQGASFACYYQLGFNAIDNKFYGGDFQNYSMHGIYCDAAPISVYSTSFESTYGYTQYLNGGWDIFQHAAGVNEGGAIIACRSESFRFLSNGGSNFYAISACNGIQAISSADNSLTTWSALTAYGGVGQSQAIIVAGNFFNSRHRGQVWVATTPGTSGAVQPSWTAAPVSPATISDGSVTWTYLDYDFINNTEGSVDFQTCQNVFNGGRIRAVPPANLVGAPGSYTIGTYFAFPEQFIGVDATSGPVTITLPQSWFDRPYPVCIQKVDSSGNAVTVATSAAGAGFSPGTINTLSAQWNSFTYMRAASAGNDITAVAAFP